MQFAFTRTFSGDDDFQATREAETFLRDLGFSIGAPQRDMPRGIVFGACLISKWSGMDQGERQQLDGRIDGPLRTGPVTVTIRKYASPDALGAISKEQGA